MTPEHWQPVKEVLNAALGRDPHERAAFISKACGGDESLRQEVGIAHHLSWRSRQLY